MKKYRAPQSLSLTICLFGILVFSSCNRNIESLSDLVISDVEKIADGFFFTEGPAWHREGYLLFSDLQLNRIHKWSEEGGLEIWREPSRYANGLAFDPEGRLIACESSGRRVTRTEADGSISILAHRYKGNKLNTPNDLVIRSDGTIYFTDPVWALLLLGPELDFRGVYVLKPGEESVLLLNDMGEPNGIGLSPDEKTLYVVDTKKRHIRAFDIKCNDTLSGGEILIESIPSADGMTTDTKGNIYAAGQDGITVCDRNGIHLGLIEIPEPAANCTFGGQDFRTLFITASKSLYRVRLKFPGRIVWR